MVTVSVSVLHDQGEKEGLGAMRAAGSSTRTFVGLSLMMKVVSYDDQTVDFIFPLRLQINGRRAFSGFPFAPKPRGMVP